MNQTFAPGIRVGGSALPDGVMMLTPLAAAIAREQSDGTFEVETFALPERKPSRIEKVPFIRILPKLVHQMAFVVRGWKPKQDKFPVGILVFALGIGLLSTVLNLTMAQLPSVWHMLSSSILQLLLFFGIIGLSRLVPRFGRIWRFHGGEHQAIAAYEAGMELTPENAITRTLYHPRCGTNLATLAMIFMVPGMVLGTILPGIVGYTVTLLVPLPAMCVAFEIVMLAQNRMRIILWPGLAFQRLTVAMPGPAESLAGITALRAALTEHARIEAQKLANTSRDLTTAGARSAS
jgi:uncharacterized protein YqhQ